MDWSLRAAIGGLPNTSVITMHSIGRLGRRRGICTKGQRVILNSRLHNNHTFNGLGSGLFQQYGAFTMQNSTVDANTGTGGIYSPLFGEYGGGLFLLQATVSINNSSILNNSAGYGSVNLDVSPYGGGIYLYSSGRPLTTPSSRAMWPRKMNTAGAAGWRLNLAA